MSNKRSKKQIFTAVMLIPLLLLSGCGLASESISTETPSPTATETPIPAPTITPTVTPTPGLPPEIAIKFGEDVPELVKNEQGYFVENARWKATYENGEWELLPRPTTCYDKWVLEEVEREYLERPDTPKTMADVRNQMNKDPLYTNGYNDFFGVFDSEGNIPDIFLFRSKTVGFVEVNLEGRSGSEHGDVGIARVSVRPDFPDRYICEIIAVERDNQYYQLGNMRILGERVHLEDKEVLNQFVLNQFIGKLAKSNPIFTTPDSGWDDSFYSQLSIYPDYEVISAHLKNPKGYIERWTQIENSSDYNKGRLWIDIFKEIIDRMDSSPEGDAGFITTHWHVLEP